LWQAQPRRLHIDFEGTNGSNSTYPIAKESEEIPIQYAPSRTVGGSLKFHFWGPIEMGGINRPASLSNNWPGRRPRVGSVIAVLRHLRNGRQRTVQDSPVQNQTVYSCDTAY